MTRIQPRRRKPNKVSKRARQTVKSKTKTRGVVERPISEPWTRLSAGGWRKLLVAEKLRRGVAADSLVFVGAKNVAQYWWCAQQSVLKSRDEEMMFFMSYLEDRLQYSLDLGRVDALPKEPEKWLAIGDNITNADLEPLVAPQQMGQGKGFSGIPYTASTF